MGRVVAVTGLGDLKQLEASFRKAGLVVDETANSMVNSSKRAGEAAAAQAREAGASADEQAAAAARAAAAYVGAQDEMSRAQKAAAKAAADAARAAGLSADEQEAAAKRAAAAAVESGSRIGHAFDDGTSKAGGALKKLGALGATWGIPFSGSLSKIGKEFDEAGSKGEKFASVMSAAGKLTVGAGLIGFAAAAYEGVKGAAALEKQMEMIHTQAGASQAEVKHLTGAVLDMAGSVATGPKTLAEGLYHVESVGMHGAKAMHVLEIASEGAKIGGANLVDVTNALDAAIVSGVPGVQNYQQAMGDLNATVGAGDMKMQDLADAYGTGLLGAVKHTGVAINDVNAALAVFGDNNIRGADAGTKLNSALRIMAAPSIQASKALAAVGMTATQMGSDLRSPQGLLKALEDLHKHLVASGATPEQTNLILTRAFGGKQATGVELLLGQLSRLEEKYKQIDKGSGSFGKDWSATQHTLAFETDQLKAETQALADKFGLFLIPKLQETEHAISDVVSWMEKHKSVAEALGLTIAGVLGLAVTVFAEQKAVAFGKATLRMFEDVGKLASGVKAKTGEMVASFGEQDAAAQAASDRIAAAEAQEAEAVSAAAGKVEADNVAVSDSFAAEAGVAEAAAASIDGAVAGEAAAVQSANAEIEASNSAAGASFTGLASKIGAIGVAFAVAEGGAHAFGSALEAITGEKQAKSIGELFGGTNEHTDEGQRSINAWNKAQDQRVLNTGGGIMAFFESKGLTRAEAAGIVGNFQQESSLNFKDPGGGIDQGLGSRDHSRLSNVGQLEAIWHELLAGEGGVLKIFHEHPLMGPAEAARIFSERFERPGKPMLTNRERYATEAFHAHPHANRGSGSHHSVSVSVPRENPSAVLQEYLETVTGHKKKTAAALGIPVGVITMLKTAEALLGSHYTHGGGHSGWDPVAELKKIGVDCSGFVSQVLHAGGVKMPGPQTTLGLPHYLAKGAGRYVTVYDRPSGSQAHTLVETLGHYFESGGNAKYNPKGGVTMLTSAQAAGELSGGGFQAFHPTGALNEPLKGGISQRLALQLTGVNLSAQIAAQFAAEVKRMEGSGSSLLKKYESDIQSGTPRVLEKALGYSSAHKQGHGSQAYKEYEGLVHELRSVHVAVLNHLASQLVGAHREALKTLAQGLHAAQLKHDAETLQLRADKLRDEQQLATDTAAGQLQVAKDQEQQVVDAMRSATQHIEDMTQLISGRFAAMAQTVEDQTRIMADSSAGVVQSIRDQTQVNVDIFGERGLYGLNLIAQQEQVQLDQMKLSYDKQIEQARVALDQLKAQEDQTVSQKQQVANELQLQDDTQLAKLEAHFDAVQLAEHQATASARQHLDLVTLQRDSDVDAKQLIVAIDTGKKRSVEEEASAELKRAEKYRTLTMQEAQGELTGAETHANQLVTKAQNELETFKAQAAQAQAKARQELEEAKGNATVVLANAQQSLQGLESKASEAEARLEKEIAEIRAEAQTQYAGSGLQVNITGINPTDSAVIVSEVGWVLKTQVPA